MEVASCYNIFCIFLASSKLEELSLRSASRHFPVSAVKEGWTIFLTVRPSHFVSPLNLTKTQVQHLKWKGGFIFLATIRDS